MKILINGAGIAGLSLAYCLLRDHHDVTVVEKSPQLRDDGYMIDFFGPGYDAAERLGILAQLEAIHYPITLLSFLNDDGAEKFSLPYTAFRRRIFGNRHFNFMRGELERVLYKRISSAAILRFGATVQSFQQCIDCVDVVLSDQYRCQVDLLVGADGIHSTIRKLAFGHTQERFLGYHALAFLVNDPELTSQMQNRLYSMTVPGKQVSVYPVRGGRIATLFLHSREKAGEEFSTDVALAELQETYGGMGWIIPRLLEQCGKESGVYFDAVSQIVLPTWSKGRVVLIGDACHCVSLLAGQGASLAMAGAYVLYEELVRPGHTVAAALSKYEKRLRPVVENKQRTGRKLARRFVPDSIFQIKVRDLFLRTSTWPIASRIVRRQVGAAPYQLFHN